MLDTAGGVIMNSLATSSSGPLQTNEHMLDEQLEVINSNSADIGCGLEDLQKEIEDRDEWQGRVWGIRARSMTLMMIKLYFMTPGCSAIK